MNKIISVIISLILIFNCSLVAFADTSSSHWADEYLNALVSDGIVKGDGSGYKLDSTITRAEFVALINRAFGYTDAGYDNFHDIAGDKWYFNDFLIAKKAGYINGDSYGNANPESFITRIEAAAIIQRNLRLTGARAEKFSDDEKIADWGKEAVYTLAYNKIINGYENNTFKPQNSITRAETFVILYNSKYVGQKQENKDDSLEDITLPNVSYPTSSGGGGGGGGGGYLPTPVKPSNFKISKIDETEGYEKLIWTDASASYIVNIKRTTEGKAKVFPVLTLQTNILDIKAFAEENIPVSDRVPYESFNISVTSGSETLAADIKVTFPHVKKAKPKAYSKIENGNEIIYVKWDKDENSSSYTLNLKLDGAKFVNIPVNEDNGKMVGIIPNTYYASLSDKCEISLTGLSNSSTILDMETVMGEILLPLYYQTESYEGKGLEKEPFVVANERHFKNIEKNPGLSFRVDNDISLSDYTAFEFSGNLIGNDENNYPLITVDIKNDDPSVYTGLFSTVDGGNIKYLKLAGTIEGNSQYVGGFAGYLDKTGVISYVENYANIKSTSSISGSYAAGIAGSKTTDATVTYAINHGNIESSKAAAGIVGVAFGIDYAANLGNVTATGGNAAGIAAALTSSASSCYNLGNIKTTHATSVAAGLFASATGNAKTVTACYNKGKIEGATEAGIIRVSSATSTYTLNSCYNAGAFGSSAAFNPIYDLVTGAKVSANDCCYLSDTLKDDGRDNTEALTQQGLKNKEFDSALYTKVEGNYPQLKNLLEKIRVVSLTVPTVIKESLDNDDLKLTISGDTETAEYEITIYDNEACDGTPLYTGIIPGGTQKTETISASYFTEYDRDYYVKVRAKGDGVYTFDSAEAKISYKKESIKLNAPSITVVSSNGEYTLKITAKDTNTEKYKVSLYDNNSYAGEPLNAGFEYTQNGLSQDYNLTSYLGGFKPYYVKVIGEGNGQKYKDSDSVYAEFEKGVEKLNILKLADFTSDGSETDEKYTFTWETTDDPYLSGFSVLVEENGVLVTETVANLDKTATSYTLGGEYYEAGKKYKVTITALSSDETAKKNSEPISSEIDTTYAGGSGTESNPYILKNSRHFVNISKNPSAYYALVKDITLDQTNGAYTPIATFSGTLAGANADTLALETRTITVNYNGDATATTAGVFKTIGGTIKNIKLTGSFVITDATATCHIGGLAADITDNVNIIDCESNIVFDITTGKTTYVGGLLGYLGSAKNVTFTNCKSTGSFTTNSTPTTYYVGGLYGYHYGNTTATFINCHNSAEISGKFQQVGGLLGGVARKGASFTNCSNTASLTGGKYVGGLLGSIHAHASYERSVTIDKCFNEGTITSASGVAAGLTAGSAKDASAKGADTIIITDSYNIGTISTTSGTAAAIAVNNPANYASYNNSLTINRCYDASETGNFSLSTDTMSLTNCYYLSDATDTENGGLTPLSDTDMKDYTRFTGFDFTTVWYEPDVSETYKYPTLRPYNE